MLECPNCGSTDYEKLAHINGDTLYSCEECGETWKGKKWGLTRAGT